MTENGASTPQTYIEETWEAIVGNEKIYLTKEEVEVIKKADLEGRRGLVWLRGKAIAIPFIQAIVLVEKKKVLKQSSLPFPSASPGEEEKERWEKWKKILKEKIDKGGLNEVSANYY